MKMIRVPDSVKAVEAVAPFLIGKRIRINDVFAGQNILLDNDGFITRKLDTKKRADCWQCLVNETGYRKPMQVPGYVLERGEEFRMPARLTACKAMLGDKPSTITIETEDGAVVTFAFVEGCCGGIGRINEHRRRNTVGLTTSETPEDEKRPIIVGDPELVPIVFLAITSLNLYGNCRNTADIWRTLEIGELPLESIYFDGYSVITGEQSANFNGIFLRFPQHIVTREWSKQPVEFTSQLLLKFRHCEDGERLFWIDITKDGETTRYKVDGLPSLVFDFDE